MSGATPIRVEEMIHDVLQAGALGYLLKDITADELTRAIHNAVAGQPTLAPEALHALVHPEPEATELPIGQDLTEREREVLVLLVRGDTTHKLPKCSF